MSVKSLSATHNSGAGNGCANFMDAWKKSVRSARKAMSIKFLVLRGGGYFEFFFGGECRFYFCGHEDFSESFQYGMNFSFENGFIIPGLSLLAAGKQGPGLNISSRNESCKPRLRFSSENGFYMRGGMEKYVCRALGPLGLYWQAIVACNVAVL